MSQKNAVHLHGIDIEKPALRNHGLGGRKLFIKSCPERKMSRHYPLDNLRLNKLGVSVVQQETLFCQS